MTYLKNKNLSQSSAGGWIESFIDADTNASPQTVPFQRFIGIQSVSSNISPRSQADSDSKLLEELTFILNQLPTSSKRWAEQYTMGNENDIFSFVDARPRIAELLAEIPEHVQEFFGAVEIHLEIITLPYDSKKMQLAAFVITKDKPVDASNKMDNLFWSDFGTKLYDAADELFVTVKFV